VRLDQPIQAQVVVELVGDPEGVKEGGVLSQVQREINVEALPLEIPERLELDVSGMAIGDTLRLADLPAREGVTYLDDAEETVLATVGAPTQIVEPEPEEEELAEGEERPEGGGRRCWPRSAHPRRSSSLSPRKRSSQRARSCPRARCRRARRHRRAPPRRRPSRRRAPPASRARPKAKRPWRDAARRRGAMVVPRQGRRERS